MDKKLSKKLIPGFPISKLKGAKYNPPKRGKDKGFTHLVKSLAAIGLIDPITITKDGMIINGHRRVAAAKELGWETIEAIVYIGEASPEEVYAQVNATALKLNGHQNLQVYLHNPNAVTERARSNFAREAERYGVAMLKELAAKGMSLNILRTARRVAAYLDIEDDKQTKTIAKWLILYRNSRMVHAYIETQQAARPLLLAINANKAMKAVYRSA